jgi:hypothetical protein
MTVFKVIQKVDSINIPSAGGISTSTPIALKTGYIRVSPELDAYIDIGPNPGINTANSLWVKGGDSVIIKEEWGSKSFVGIETGSNTTIVFQAGTGNGFLPGDCVAIRNSNVVGVNTTFSTVVEVNQSTAYDSAYGEKLVLDWNTNSISSLSPINGELRKVVRVAAYNAGSSKNTIHIMEVQVNSYA